MQSGVLARNSISRTFSLLLVASLSSGCGILDGSNCITPTPPSLIITVVDSATNSAITNPTISVRNQSGRLLEAKYQTDDRLPGYYVNDGVGKFDVTIDVERYHRYTRNDVVVSTDKKCKSLTNTVMLTAKLSRIF